LRFLFLSAPLQFLDRTRAIALALKKRTLQFNLFESHISWTDLNRRQTEIFTTRLYVVLLSLCIIMMSIYMSSILQSKVFTLKNPSKQTFDELNSNPRYSPTLQCPCQNLTIPYSRFIQISAHFHQICTSDFVVTNSQWIKLFSGFLLSSGYSYDDFRLFLIPQFRALASLCRSANETVTDAVNAFLAGNLITNQADPNETVQSRTTSIVSQFKQSTTGSFTTIFKHVQDMIESNRFLSTTMSNWYLPDILVLVFRTEEVKNLPRSYENGTCSCQKSPTCSSTARIDQWHVPGFRVGCYPIASLMQSTLACLYDIVCIQQLMPNDTGSTMIFRALDPALSSSNVTVQSLVEVLLIDEWKVNINYDHYYAACAPRYCTYSLTRRFDSVYIITTIVGLSGGLAAALKLFLPPAVKLGRYIARYRSGAVQPMVISNTSSA
jgi:hypothetical protein